MFKRASLHPSASQRLQLVRSAFVGPSVPLRSHPRAAAGKGGFGQTSKKKTDTKEAGLYLRPELNQRLAQELGLKDAAASEETKGDGWKLLGEQSELFKVKEVKAVELGSLTLALFRHNKKVYCSDALSTAFKYPLIDAKILEGAEGQPIIETPLDGTQYDLATGKVVVWCPSSDPVRSVLGMLKKDTPQQDLKVYPVDVIKGKVWVKLR